MQNLSTLVFTIADGSEVSIPLPAEWEAKPVPVQHHDGSTSYEIVAVIRYSGAVRVKQIKTDEQLKE